MERFIVSGLVMLAGCGDVATSGSTQAVEVAPGSATWYAFFGPDPGIVGVASGADGSALVALTYHTDLTVDSETIPALPPFLNTDAALIAWDAEGGFLWARKYGDDENSARVGPLESDDDTGEIAIAARLDGSVATTGVDLGCGQPGAQVSIAMLHADGTCAWQAPIHADQSLEEQSTARILRIAPDRHGGIVATGFFTGTADFGRGPITGGFDTPFVADWHAGGRLHWVRTGFVGGLLVVDHDGRITVAFRDAAGAIELVGLDREGGRRFTRTYLADELVLEGLAVAADGRLALTGRFEGTLYELGRRLLVTSNPTVFLLGLGSDGHERWSRAIDATDATSVAFDGHGGIDLAIEARDGDLATTRRSATDGAPIWTTHHGRATGQLAVVKHDEGDFFLAGAFVHFIDLGTGQIPSPFAPHGSGFIARIQR